MPYSDPEIRKEKAREYSRRHYLRNREAKLAQSSAWRAANPEKARAFCAAWREKNVDYMREQSREWRAKHPEWDKQWRAANPDKAKAIKKRYRELHPDSDREWKAANPEKVKAYRQRYAKKNPEKRAAKNQLYQARKKGAPVVERVDRAAIIARDKSICHLCGEIVEKKDMTLDHVVPLARGGHHTADNLRVAHRSCNSRKGAHLLDAA